MVIKNIKEVYDVLRHEGFSRTGSFLILGTPILTGLAPIVYAIASCDLKENYDLSVLQLATALPSCIVCGYFGFVIGSAIATSLKMQKNRNIHKLNPREKVSRLEEKTK
jgi:hypothetical protein